MFVHHKNWLTYSSKTDRSDEMRYNFSNDFSQIVNFPTRIPGCDSQSTAVLDSFLSSDASICFIIAFPLLGYFDHVVVSASVDFLSNSKRDVTFYRVAYDCYCAG